MKMFFFSAIFICAAADKVNPEQIETFLFYESVYSNQKISSKCWESENPLKNSNWRFQMHRFHCKSYFIHSFRLFYHVSLLCLSLDQIKVNPFLLGFFSRILKILVKLYYWFVLNSHTFISFNQKRRCGQFLSF